MPNEGLGGPGGPERGAERPGAAGHGERVRRPPLCRACGAGDVAGRGFSDSDEELWYYYDNNGEYDEDEERWDAASKECDVQADKDSGPGTFCGFRKSFLCKDPSPVLLSHSSLGSKLLDLKLPQRQEVTVEEAERNAKELVAEEERVKRKAEKKRLKKKRQKDRKRQEKLGQELKVELEMKLSELCLNGDTEKDEGAGHLDASSSQGDPSEDPAHRRAGGAKAQGGSADVNTEEMEDELDLSSTFVSKAQRKVGVKPLTARKERAPRAEDKEPDRKPKQERPRPGQDGSVLDPSAVLAGYGNEAASQGCFQEAVLLFTEAIKLNPREHRLFGNRSYCYERMQHYGRALSDAHVALSLLPGWPKGLFRKGKALLGLKRYAEARSTFLELLRLDRSHADAAAQLEICQMQLMLESGLSSIPSESSVPVGLLPKALELQPAGFGKQARSCGYGEGDEDRESGFVKITNLRSRGKGPAQRALQTSSRHPGSTPHQARGWYAVWVGNVTPRITQKLLRSCFEMFGPIHSVRMLPEKYCAFINYTQKEAAEAAFGALQGAEVEGTKFVLQLKHPDHATPPPGRAAPSSALRPLVREPVRVPPTLECHFWRNTGCSYGADCRFRHLPQNKGLDKKLAPQ